MLNIWANLKNILVIGRCKKSLKTDYENLCSACVPLSGARSGSKTNTRSGPGLDLKLCGSICLPFCELFMNYSYLYSNIDFMNHFFEKSFSNGRGT
jgi:hypothetical protein